MEDRRKDEEMTTPITLPPMDELTLTELRRRYEETTDAETRTRYQILNQANDAADATLRGTVLTTTASPLTYDSKTGRAESILVVVSMRVSLTDRQGKVLFQNPSYVFREQYQVSQEPSSFFEEDSPAMGRLSRDFAHTLVSGVLEGF